MDYYCAKCGALAGRVELLESEYLQVSGFSGVVKEAVSASEYLRLQEILCHSDPHLLWARRPLSAPFYCPQCRASYCSSHWSVVEVYDEDFPSHYDYSRGSCPAGHSRLIED